MRSTPKYFADRWGGPKFCKAWLALCGAVDDRTPLPGFGVMVSDQPGVGRMITASATLATILSKYPFQVVSEKDPESEGFRCYIYEGAVFNSLKPKDKLDLDITGLTLRTELETIPPTPHWRVLLPTDVIWLTLVFDGEALVTSATINSLGESDVFNLDELAWSRNDGYCEDDEAGPPKHQTSRIVLAYSYPSAESPLTPIVVNKVNTDLLLRNCNIDGRAARYPFPTAGGYPISL